MDHSRLHRLDVRPNPSHQRSGVKAYASLMSKYGFQSTTDGPLYFGPHRRFFYNGSFFTVQQKVLQKRDSLGNHKGLVTGRDIQHDSEYICDVTLGTPAQKMTLNFDTGSADLWVWSDKLSTLVQAEGRRTGHKVFSSSTSRTFSLLTGRTWKITYGDGSNASGVVGTDTLNMGGLIVEGQAIELAKKISNQFQSNPGDGLLGLAWGSINTVQPESVLTPVQNMIQQKDISESLFTAYLGSWRDANEADKGESFYTFGYIDQDVLKAANAQPYYTPVDNKRGFWEFNSTLTTIGEDKVHQAGNTAIADTGTTLALVSDKVCKAIYAQIPGARYDWQNQGYVFPTNTPAKNLPVVSFSVGGKTFAVAKEDLGYAPIGNGMWYGAIQSRGTLPFDILGGTFLKAIYAIFDVGNQRFGAVQRIEKYQNISLPGKDQTESGDKQKSGKTLLKEPDSTETQSSWEQNPEERYKVPKVVEATRDV